MPILLASAVVTLPLQPAWSAWRDGNWRPLQVQQDRLRVDSSTAANYELLRALADRYAPAGRTFLTVPFWPGAYAALGRPSPIWEIFNLFERTPEFQNREIARMQAANPGFVVVNEIALDGVDTRRFRYTHPLMDRYIREHFIPLANLNVDANLRVYKAADQ